MVAHSSGAVSSRFYIRFLGGSSKVRDYVSLAGANHGNDYACWFPTQGGKDLCPAYTDDPESLLGKLNDIASPTPDETPFGVEEGGPIHWHAFWSGSDVIISPNQSECLDQHAKNDCSSPVNEAWPSKGHQDFPKDSEVLTRVLELVGQHDILAP
jgi:triacylglycerol lipase